MPLRPNAAAAQPDYRTDTLIIGAGQAGLAAAYYLRQAGVPCLLLERDAAIGQQWATRYDSLRLFSPAWASGLPGLPWPGPQRRYPTKDETAAYLRHYAAHFDFDIHLNQLVTHLGADSAGGFEALTAAGTRYRARRVIVCTGGYAGPKVPAWAGALPSSVPQLHSSQYQRPAQLPDGAVAVVGSGNSALQIAADLAATGRPVYVGFDERVKPMPNNTLMWAGLTTFGLLRASRHGLLGGWMQRQPEPVVAADLHRLRRFPNAHFIGRARAVEGATLVGAKAVTPALAAVVWATGFRPDFGWIDLPACGADGEPLHRRGLSRTVPGLAFLGLPWLDSRSSALLHGVGRDAHRVVTGLLGLETPVERKKGNSDWSS